jgi:hypothetical protein
VIVSSDLVAEYEEWQALERFHKIQAEKKPEPKPELVNPHLAYTTGPSGQMIADWSAFRGNPTPEQLEINCTVEDRRDNRDPEQLWLDTIARRKEMELKHGGFEVIDKIAEQNGQMSFDDVGLDSA